MVASSVVIVAVQKAIYLFILDTPRALTANTRQ